MKKYHLIKGAVCVHMSVLKHNRKFSYAKNKKQAFFSHNAGYFSEYITLHKYLYSHSLPSFYFSENFYSRIKLFCEKNNI